MAWKTSHVRESLSGAQLLFLTVEEELGASGW